MYGQPIDLPIPMSDLRRLLRSHGVKRARLFGSYARNQQTKSSDLDLLVDYANGVSYFDHIDLQKDLERVTGVRVDLVTKLHPSFRPYIEPDLVDIKL